METKKNIYFPPVRRNYFRCANISVQPVQREYFKSPNQRTKYNFPPPVNNSKERDLTVSPRYIQFHKDILHRSRVSLTEDFVSFKSHQKTPINLVRLSDYELEKWRHS